VLGVGETGSTSTRHLRHGWRSGLVVALGLVLLTGAAGCRRTADASSDLVITHEINPSPPIVGSSTVALRIADVAGKPVAGAKVSVEGNMSHPGMQPVFSNAKETEPGRYVAPLELTMAGDWILSVSVTLPDGRTVGEEIDVRGVKAR